jgi:hypothetical protein
MPTRLNGQMSCEQVGRCSEVEVLQRDTAKWDHDHFSNAPRIAENGRQAMELGRRMRDKRLNVQRHS